MADRLSQCSSDDHVQGANNKVQLSGVLMKRPIGHNSNKWSKRFFVVKEGFLFYYQESERKAFEKRGVFNIHPKGAVPLGGCIVEPAVELGQQYAIHVQGDDLGNVIVALAAENHYERERWMRVLQEAARITWKNTLLGDALIRELETQGLQLCKERQDYFDKLQEESIALRDEMDRNEELGKVTTELDKERNKLEAMMLELKEEHERTRREYEKTIQAVHSVQNDKVLLERDTQILQSTLHELATEKRMTLQALRDIQEENCKLSQTTEELNTNLKMIEEETKIIMEEKTDLEKRFVDNELRSKILEEEKQLISQEADHLQSTLQDLIAQKELTEAELKEEVVARIEAECRLRSAEISVYRLENALQQNVGNVSNDVREEMLPDVKKLKKFFEDVAEEAKIDANKPFIMKNAVMARKVYAQRARTLRIKASREEKARSLVMLLDGSQDSATLTLRRSQSISVGHDRKPKRTIVRRSGSTYSKLPSMSDPLLEHEDDDTEGVAWSPEPQMKRV